MARFKTAAAFVAAALALVGLAQPPTPATRTAPRSSRHEFRDAAYGSFAAAGAPRAAASPRALGSSRDYALLFPAQSGAPYARWNPCKPISWKVNPRWAPPGAMADLSGAVARVHAATGLTFVYTGTTTLVPGTAAYDAADTDGTIVVAWAPDGSTTLIPKAPRGRTGLMGMAGGFATTGSGADGRQYATIVKGYVLLSTSFPTLAGGFGWGNRYGWLGTRGMLDMHELGHAVGLDHARGATQVMYPVAQRMPANWGAGDLTGLRLVGRSAGCIPPITG